MARAPLLYIITDRKATGGRPLVEVVAAAMAGAAGAGDRVAVQLREKDLDGRALHRLAEELRAVTAAAGVPLYINDRVDVALAVGADGVHLGGQSLVPADVRALAPGLRIGVSTHARDEVIAAADAGVDFVVYGPVFPTPSKPDRVMGIDSLELVAGLGVPVLALGGIDPKNAQACLKKGAAGVATIRSVMSATKIDKTVSLLLACLNGLQT
jgi:thiamine-phosphate pyrophosphorylase